MIGQKHYVIARAEGGRQKYWRSRGNQHQPARWTWDLAACHKYRTAADALRAARQLDSDYAELEVCELNMLVSRVCHRLRVDS